MAPQHQQTKEMDELLSGSQSSKLMPTADDISETFAEDPPYIKDKLNQNKRSDKDKSERARRMMMQLDEENEVDEESDEDDDASEDSELSNNYDYDEASHPLQGERKWKWVAEITLVLLAILITAATWVVLSGTQENNQVAQFTLAATQIAEGIHSRSHRLTESLQAQSLTITDLTKATATEWPYYAPNNGSYEHQAKHVREEANLQILAVAPLVHAVARDSWNRFVEYQKGRVNVSSVPLYYYSKGVPTPYTSVPQADDATTAPTLADQINSLHAPLWLLSPPPKEPKVINYDVLSSKEAQNLFQAMFHAPDTGTSVISEILDFTRLQEIAYGNDNESLALPHSLVFQPIYDSYLDSVDSSSSDLPPPVGILIGIMYWHSYLSNLLPNTTKGMIAEFQNTCGQSVQYQLDGETVTFLGSGAAAEPSEALLYKIPFITTDVAATTQNHASSSNGACEYTLYVYPSPHFLVKSSSSNHSSEATSNAALYTAIVAILFALGIIIVLFAIRRIQKRQDQAVDDANEANTLLASILPNSSNTRFASMFPNNPFALWADSNNQDQTATAELLLSARMENNERTNNNSSNSNNNNNHSCEKGDTLGGLKSISNHRAHNRRASMSQRQDSVSSFGMESGAGLDRSGGFLDRSAGDGMDVSGKSHTTSKSYTTGKGSKGSRGKKISRQTNHAVNDKIRAAKEAARLQSMFASRPIADLFPDSTVLFADIVGFTAWSSSREPRHIFELLESIFHTFDEIAKKRGVFKVDTVGDCYCCVTGVPIPKEDHAVGMADFAREILSAFNVVASTLEVQLGPDTADLSMRAGIHSGPVTAGVLRGDRNRFQLFGSTVNRAAKIEAEAEPGRIVISKETADLLAAAGKDSWFMHRQKHVVVGRGQLHTFWLDPRASECETLDLNRRGAHPMLARASMLIQKMDENCLIKTKHQRQVDWIVDQMERLLKQVLVQRRHIQAAKGQLGDTIIPQAAIAQSEVCVFEEVKEVIPMPTFDALAALDIKVVDDVELSADVLWQLHDFVTSISTMYRDNPFHNFQHASHVTMSVVKLLSRVLCPTDYAAQTESADDRDGGFRNSAKKNKMEMHDFSYGISSDPLTHFAVVFGALIHDVDHVGVSNAQLVAEGSRLARIYKSQSVAEQNSVNIAWDLLMDPAFEALRRCIYTSEEEFNRFRATVVNVVMATDIVDKDLKNLRNARWEKAFSKEEGYKPTKEDSDRKATIVLEHLIQASDISHTMQHWHVYQKWNHKLFRELYIAHVKGRMAGNPADFWYNGEIGFFDFYIIPLAKKLRDCGVFGVSCDEFLNYACENRAQWEKEGEEVVHGLIKQVANDETIKALKRKYNYGGEKENQVV